MNLATSNGALLQTTPGKNGCATDLLVWSFATAATNSSKSNGMPVAWPGPATSIAQMPLSLHVPCIDRRSCHQVLVTECVPAVSLGKNG